MKNRITSYVRLVDNSELDYLDSVTAKEAIDNLFTDDTGPKVEVMIIEAWDDDGKRLILSLRGDGRINFQITD